MGVTPTGDLQGGVAPLALAAVAAVAHTLVGGLYLVSGLVVPPYALILLLVWWVVLARFLWHLVRNRSWWTPVVPLAAAATWLAVLTAGGQILGWTA